MPEVTAHGMRGLHSTLTMEAGVTGAVVAASLGHEHVSTTVQSYVGFQGLRPGDVWASNRYFQSA